MTDRNPADDASLDSSMEDRLLVFRLGKELYGLPLEIVV